MLYFIKSKSIKTYHMFSSDLLSFIISFKMVYSNSKEICKDLGKFSLEKKKKSVNFHTFDADPPVSAILGLYFRLILNGLFNVILTGSFLLTVQK